MKKLLLYACFSLCLLAKLAAQPCNMSGVYTIGSGGQYPSITSAVAALRTNGMAGAVTLELRPNYSSASEVYPLTFSRIACISAANTLTIRPQAGATGLQISSSNATATLNLDSARYIRFDGRPGGTGTAAELTLNNTGTAGSTIRFINDASYNTFSYLQLKGVNSSATNGIISFLTSTQSVTSGNSYNTISNCTIGDGTGGPVNCIYAAGSAGKKNSNNSISNCNIVNYSTAYNTNNSNGIILNQNNTAWTIDGNSFYQTHSVLYAAYATTAIFINDTTSTGFVVQNNFIGGMAPNCAGAASQYYNQFCGIKLLVSATGVTSVQNNTITNINYRTTTSVAYRSLAGIHLGNGKIDCGTIAGNTIGSPTQYAAISATGSEDNEVSGILAGYLDFAGVLDSINIKNNKIGGLSASSLTNSYQSTTLSGIRVKDQSNGYVNITGNTIGSPALPNALYNSLYNTTTNQNLVAGIYTNVANSAIASPSVAANTIASNSVMDLFGRASGITVYGGRPTILNNTVRDLSSIISQAAITGIDLSTTKPGTLVNGNTVFNLYNLNTTNPMYLTGVKVYSSKGFTVSKNLVHTLQPRYSDVNYDYLYGVDASGTAYTLSNNMIRLGIDSAGNPVGKAQIMGINAVLDSCSIIHNSIYIGGNVIFNNTALNLTSGAGRPCNIANNILVNGQTGTIINNSKNYLIQLPSLAVAKTLLVNHNIYYAPDTARSYISSLVGSQLSGMAYNRIIDWRAATGLDSNSYYYNPNFVNATGNTNNVNLHLANPTAAEGMGLASLTTTDDFDGDNRAANSPVDIGADAGNFTLQDGDAPVLTHQAFLGQPIPSAFVYQVKITDNGGGIDTAGNKKPRMWFRKKYPVASNWFSNVGTMLSGNPAGSVWGFKPDFTTAGLTFNPGDSVEYYFVAQDKGPVINVGYSNTAGAKHARVDSQFTAPTTPLRLLIYGLFPSTVYVGAGQTYPSLTRDGGFFEATKKYLFDTTATTSGMVYITSDLSETGKHYFNTLNGSKVAVTLTTNTPTVKTIRSSGVMAEAMMTLFNTDKVIVDGAVNGTGRYLRFVNVASSNANYSYIGPQIIELNGNIGDVTIQNCVFESNVSDINSGVIDLYCYKSRRVLVQNNVISDIQGGPAGFYKTGISGAYNYATDSVIIRNNQISNFLTYGIQMQVSSYYSISSGYIPLLYTIDSNHLFYTTPTYTQAGNRTAIDVTTIGGIFVKDNFIGGSAPYCGGTPWTSSDNLTAINVGATAYRASFIDGNTIRNIRLGSYTNNFKGINLVSGTMNIGTLKGNLIGSLTSDSSIVAAGVVSGIYGISTNYNNGYLGTVRVENNTVSGITSNNVTGIYYNCGKGNFSGNLITRFRTRSSIFYSPMFTGMAIAADTGTITKNEIYDLLTNATNAGNAYGLSLSGSSTVVSKNRVYKLSIGSTTTSAALAALRIDGLSGAKLDIQNNQLEVSNEGGSPTVKVYGIYDNGQTGNFKKTSIRYNTIHIGGTTTGTLPSYGVYIEGGAPIDLFRNNLIYNERTSGTNKHLAVGMISASTSPVMWNGPGTGNNLYVTADSTAVNEWKTSGAVTMRSWRSLSAGDSTSFAARVSTIPASSLFASLANGNLNINTQSPLAWYLNGKGLPQADIAADFDSTSVRSTSIVTGPADIGSHEFTPTSQPPVLIVNGLHQPGGTDTLSFAGRTVATLTWGNSGTLPTLGGAQWFSGVWPNDTTNNGTVSNARYMSGYLHIPATGGSGYSYQLTYYYDSSMLGKVANESTMVMNKRQTGIPGSWQVIRPSMVNTALKTITIDGQTSFSEFTATDANAPLPIQLLSFTAVPTGNDVLLTWKVSPADEAYFMLEKSYNAILFTALSTITAKVNGTSYAFNDQHALQNAATQHLYYRLRMVSRTGEVSYSAVVAVAIGQRDDQLVQKVLPNPFSTNLSVQLKLSKPEMLSATIRDNSGRVVYRLARRLERGYQNLQLTETSKLSAGIYWLQITAGDEARTIQLVKEK